MRASSSRSSRLDRRDRSCGASCPALRAGSGRPLRARPRSARRAGASCWRDRAARAARCGRTPCARPRSAAADVDADEDHAERDERAAEGNAGECRAERGPSASADYWSGGPMQLGDRARAGPPASRAWRGRARRRPGPPSCSLQPCPEPKWPEIAISCEAGMLLPHPADRLGAAGARHPHVAHDQRRGARSRRRTAQLQSVGLVHRVAGALEPVGDQVAHDRVIVDDQDLDRGLPSLPCSSAHSIGNAIACNLHYRRPVRLHL